MRTFNIKGPHDQRSAQRDQKHRVVIKERSRLWGAMRWRFECTCGQGSLWVRTRKYSEDLADVHHDIVLVDDAMREAFNKRARESSE